MVSIEFSGAAIRGFDDLVQALSEDAVRSPPRSTLPLIAFWRAPGQRLAELSGMIGVELALPVVLSFEHPVPVQKGVGKASFTDLMVVAASSAVAVEAKYTEPPYETVREWLGEPVRPNRKLVLEGWLELIRGANRSGVSADGVSDLPYQLIHRTASVCSVQRPVRAVVYQVFGSDAEMLRYYRDALQNLSELLGKPKNLGLHVLHCPVACLPDHAVLAERWRHGTPVGDDVRRGLLTESLFAFSGSCRRAESVPST
jgi:hypothetical protein